ncbi:MAG: thioredoxin domain-containing protein [Thermotogales bacterium]|nr:thioredoxin domain-containing protein [Thermotogales bacterium]
MILRWGIMLFLLTLYGCTQQTDNVETVKAATTTTDPAIASVEQNYREGLEYQRVEPPLPMSDQIEPGRVEVVEMFFYACPHCYELDPKLKKWLQDKPYIDFHRMPAIVGPSWADQARAFYMAEQLGDAEKLHQALFKTIHEDGEQVYNEYAVKKFFTAQGYDPEKIDELYYSQQIADRVNEARIKTVKYGLRGVPAVIVNGKFKTAPYFVRNQEEMLNVLEELVDMERAEVAEAAG